MPAACARRNAAQTPGVSSLSLLTSVPSISMARRRNHALFAGPNQGHMETEFIFLRAHIMPQNC